MRKELNFLYMHRWVLLSNVVPFGHILHIFYLKSKNAGLEHPMQLVPLKKGFYIWHVLKVGSTDGNWPI